MIAVIRTGQEGMWTCRTFFRILMWTKMTLQTIIFILPINIGAIQKAGTESYYRLGTSIDWASKKTFSVPPKDFAKWARICEHIIMHYNEGWADGFRYNLQYWEIWNEPENPPATYGKSQWTGTDEEFYAFYEVASKHLKKCFPHLKIGRNDGRL